MSLDDLRRQLLQAAVTPPFWILLNTGEQLCCQGLIKIDDIAINVKIAGIPRLILPHQINQISSTVIF